MALPLKESNAARELASILYNFLPGSGNQRWQGHVTFASVAQRVGVGHFWHVGSKEPAIARLLEQTLEHERRLFEKLMLEIVRAGLTYRKRQASPITAEEIERVNAQLLVIGFKFPDLWDSDFKASLADETGALARARVEEQRTADRLRETARTAKSVELEALRSEFYKLHAQTDRQAAGLDLERLLNRLFDLHDLKPNQPFRVQGEQIDGSFELDSEIYLLEAKWQHSPSPAADLYVFREKIEGKSRFTRGVFLSINGISDDAKEAITKGKQPLFFTMDGYDLTMILESKIGLADFLRVRQRLLADRGSVSAVFQECQFYEQSGR